MFQIQGFLWKSNLLYNLIQDERKYLCLFKDHLFYSFSSLPNCKFDKIFYKNWAPIGNSVFETDFTTVLLQTNIGRIKVASHHTCEKRKELCYYPTIPLQTHYSHTIRLVKCKKNTNYHLSVTLATGVSSGKQE